MNVKLHLALYINLVYILASPVMLCMHVYMNGLFVYMFEYMAGQKQVRPNERVHFAKI